MWDGDMWWGYKCGVGCGGYVGCVKCGWSEEGEGGGSRTHIPTV